MLSLKQWLARKPAGPKPRKPLRSARQRIKPVGKSRAAGLRKYECNKVEHFLENPRCQYPGCFRSITRGDEMDLHHAAGRNGPLLWCRKYFRTACRPHHDLAKTHIKHSRAIGWVIDVSSEEVRRLKLEELHR
jgi:hypothetical protein